MVYTDPIVSAWLPIVAAVTGLLAAPRPKFDVAAGGAADAGAGILPLQPGAPSEAGIVTNASLGAGVRSMGSRGGWTLAYRPRLFFQYPNVQGAVRPLALHRLAWNFDQAASRRVSLSGGVDASLGDLSYNNFYATLPPGTTPPPGAFTPLFVVNGSVDCAWAHTRRHSMNWGLTAGYSTSEWFDPPAGGGLETTMNGSASWGNGWRLNGRDSLSLAVGGGAFLVEERGSGRRDRVAGNLNLGWQRNLSPRSLFATSAGVVGAVLLPGGRVSVFPTANASWSSQFIGWDAAWTGNLQGGVTGFFDQGRGDYRPQANVSGGLATVWNRRWSSAADLFLSSSVSSQALQPPAYETTASLRIPVTYSIDERAQLSFGLRSSLRGPHWIERSELPWQQEFVGFAGFRWSAGTDQNRGAWLPL